MQEKHGRIVSEHTAFIAGGSSGINLRIAHGLAAAGARISLISCKPEKVEAAISWLR